MDKQGYPLNLQLFSEGGAAAAAAPAAGAQTGETGVNSAIPARNNGRKADRKQTVVYGKQPVTAGQDAADEAAAPQEEATQEQSFDELIRGKYKQDYDARVQSIVQDRLKNVKGSEEQLKKLAPALALIGQRYGVDASDISKLDVETLSQKVLDDNAYYEAKALEMGTTPEAVKEIERLKAELNMRQANERRQAQEMQIQSHFMSLAQQGEQLKGIYPSFDLRSELQNETFARLTAPGVNVPVRTAYEIVHKDEILGGAMQFTAKKTAEKLSRAVQANSMRPAENGAGQPNGVIVKDDPSKLTKKDIMEINARVKRGEKIVF